MSESAAASRSLYPVVAPVCAVGLATVVAATVSFVTAAHGATVLAGLAAFLAASLLAGIGISLSYIPALVTALAGAKPEEAGLISGLVSTSYQVGSASSAPPNSPPPV